MISTGSSTPGGSGGAKENSKCALSPPHGVPVDQLLQRIRCLSQQPGSSGDSERPAGHERVEPESAGKTEGSTGRRLAEGDETHPGSDSDWEEPLRRGDCSGGAATFRVQVRNG